MHCEAVVRNEKRRRKSEAQGRNQEEQYNERLNRSRSLSNSSRSLKQIVQNFQLHPQNIYILIGSTEFLSTVPQTSTKHTTQSLLLCVGAGSCRSGGLSITLEDGDGDGVAGVGVLDVRLDQLRGVLRRTLHVLEIIRCPCTGCHSSERSETLSAKRKTASGEPRWEKKRNAPGRMILSPTITVPVRISCTAR